VQAVSLNSLVKLSALSALVV